jgi:hypothetical protein
MLRVRDFEWKLEHLRIDEGSSRQLGDDFRMFLAVRPNLKHWTLHAWNPQLTYPSPLGITPEASVGGGRLE